MGRYDEALDNLNMAIRMNPQFAFAYWGRATVMKRLGKHESALEDFAEAIRLDPNNPEIRSSRGCFHGFVLNNIEEALEDFSQAITLDSTNWTYYGWRALMHYLQGNDFAAIEDNTEALNQMTTETNPSDRAKVHFARHKSYERIGESEKSREDYNQAKEIDPSALR
ncbi:MAG: tetratricopeptide repeat protein [Planctomycetaceae bacterium]|nr:tetratricopeptide repeat protein [Planctomycetaceae bacterium]